MDDTRVPVSRSPAQTPAEAESSRSASGFVPYGVDAQSWMGFEQRIQERRFRALLDAMDAAIAANDGDAARRALDEARELRPEAPELAEAADRVTLLPSGIPTAPAAASFWSRACGGAGMLVVGIALLFGIEWLRPQAAPVTVVPPIMVAPARVDEGTTSSRAREALPSRGGTDIERTEPVESGDRDPGGDPVVLTATATVRRISTVSARAPATVAPTVREPVGLDAAVPTGEIPDDYVAPQPRRTSRAARAASSRTAPLAARAPSASVVTRPAVSARDSSVPPLRIDETRGVTQALNQYATAYRQLDATAARAVWPSVDERALARAFAGLQSQDVSFDACDIDVRGATANASCHGRASYVGKVGSGEPRTERRTWQFELKRDGQAWKIENAEARRVAYQGQ